MWRRKRFARLSWTWCAVELTRQDIYTVPGTIDQIVFIENRTVQDKVVGADRSIDNVNNYGTGDDSGGVSAMALGVLRGLIGLVILVFAALSVSRRRKNAVEVGEDDLSLNGSLADWDSLALKPQHDSPRRNSCCRLLAAYLTISW